MDLKRITDKAKELVEKRGGTDSLKEDADELKGIARGEGSLTDKAKDALSAIKEPGDPGAVDAATTEGSPPAAEASETERQSADEKVKGEHRGKHAQGEKRGRGRGGGRHRDRERRGRDEGPAV